MRLELAERLRCPRPHATTPLVVVAAEVVERDLRRGVAGCAACRFEARFERGDLVADAVERPPIPIAGPIAGPIAVPTPEELDRLVALLGLVEPEGAVLLSGSYAAFAPSLAARTDIAVITDVPRTTDPRSTPVPEGPVAAVLGFGDALPFLDATFRAAALGAGSSNELAKAAVRSVAPRGRVVGAAALTLPSGLRELARDEREWVAEVEARPAVVELQRRG